MWRELSQGWLKVDSLVNLPAALQEFFPPDAHYSLRWVTHQKSATWMQIVMEVCAALSRDFTSQSFHCAPRISIDIR